MRSKTRTHEIICIQCPVSCKILVKIKNGEIVDIQNAGCKRGKEYAIKEITDPVRDFFTTIRVKDGITPVLSVRSTGPVPKNMLIPCSLQLNKILIFAPIKIEEVIVKDILGLGVDIIATKTINKV